MVVRLRACGHTALPSKRRRAVSSDNRAGPQPYRLMSSSRPAALGTLMALRVPASGSSKRESAAASTVLLELSSWEERGDADSRDAPSAGEAVTGTADCLLALS